ncbi:MAG: hypothetical protein IJ043_09130 [Clostridia bacterium]|nr:hypothetical protein [Clostridia bacterium]
MMKSKIVMLIALAIAFVFLILLLINSIQAHQVAKAWFTGGATLVIFIAWVINFVRNFL